MRSAEKRRVPQVKGREWELKKAASSGTFNGCLNLGNRGSRKGRPAGGRDKGGKDGTREPNRVDKVRGQRLDRLP